MATWTTTQTEVTWTAVDDPSVTWTVQVGGTGGGGGATNLNGLSDVVITAAASGDILRHNGTNWVDTPGTDHYATSAQGGLADTAVQPGDLATVATTGAYADLSGKPTLGTAAAAALLDEDDMASDSAAAVPSQQSVKAYVDANTGSGTFVVVNAGTNLSTARPVGAVTVFWQFDAGTDVGTGGANIVNAVFGDLWAVAA